MCTWHKYERIFIFVPGKVQMTMEGNLAARATPHRGLQASGAPDNLLTESRLDLKLDEARFKAMGGIILVTLIPALKCVVNIIVFHSFLSALLRKSIH